MSQSFKYLFLALSLVACQSQAPEDTTHSAYYWTTTFQLSQQKRDFIRDHHIRRLYVRFFDVVSDEQGGALPNATITFADARPRNHPNRLHHERLPHASCRLSRTAYLVADPQDVPYPRHP